MNDTCPKTVRVPKRSSSVFTFSKKAIARSAYNNSEQHQWMPYDKYEPAPIILTLPKETHLIRWRKLMFELRLTIALKQCVDNLKLIW